MKKDGDSINILFIEIYHKYKNDIYRIAYSYTLNKEDAEDIVQSTFIKLHNNINKFSNADDDVKRWLFTVAVNESKDLLKSIWRKRRVNYEELENIKDNKDNNKIKELNSILSKLDKKYRITFYLHYYEGYTAKEIANIIHISESAVKSRLLRVKEKISIEMEDIK